VINILGLALADGMQGSYRKVAATPRLNNANTCPSSALQVCILPFSGAKEPYLSKRCNAST
jgi:hypothetical protein